MIEMNLSGPQQSVPNNPPRAARAPYLALFLFLFAVYLLTYTPRINSSDGIAMFATAESLVRRGALDVEQIRWMGLQQGTFGLDGLLYSRKGVGLPLALLPFTWLGLTIPWFGTVSASLLFNAVVTALTGVLLAAYVQLLGYNQRTGMVAGLTFGLLTLAWAYAKSLFSDPFSGFLLLAAAWLLLKYKHQFKTGTAATGIALLYSFLAGLCLGWNTATRYAEVLFTPVFGLLLLYYLKITFYNLRFTLYALAAFLAPVLLIGLSLLAFNISRYGDPFNTGYLPNETFSGILGQGILGQLISPGRGLLLFSPVLILSFVGLVPALRQFRAEALLAFSVILGHLLLYGKWFMWHGGFAWGPRFLIPTLPFWVILMTPVIALVFFDATDLDSNLSGYTNTKRCTQLLRGTYIALAILTLLPQTLTVFLDFSPFQEYLLNTGLPLFHPQTFFDIRYSPLLNGWQHFAWGSLDVVWAWNGNLNWILLVILILNAVVSGIYLLQSTRPSKIRQAVLPLFTTVVAVTALLTYAHKLPDFPLQTTIASLNQSVHPDDAIILNDPAITLDFAELYKGRAPVLGLNNGGFPLPDDITERLNEITNQRQQIWWLPNWLPPEESAIEQILLATGFRARNQSVGQRRLGLFAFPQQLMEHKINTTFGRQITLRQIVYPSQVEANNAVPIKLEWHTTAPIAHNYHVFIHLVNLDGQIVAQADGQPALWTRPTSTWQAGDTIVDRHGLWLPPNTNPGNYHLLVGLYRPESGERLSLPDGTDALQLDISIR
jgi:hypothetical protein